MKAQLVADGDKKYQKTITWGNRYSKVVYRNKKKYNRKNKDWKTEL